MNSFFKKKKNVAILSIILASLIIIAGVLCAIKYHQKKEAKVKETNEFAVLKEKSKTEVLGKDTEAEKKEYEEKYTKEYKQYLELTEEQKEKQEVIPKKYEVNTEVIEDIVKEQKKNTDTKIKKDDGVVEFSTPKKFNLAEKIAIKTEDQGNYGLCWAFASNKSLETNLALKENKKYDFSEMHVNYITSNLLIGNRELNDSGSFEVYKDYLIDSGAVLEKEVAYEEYGEEEYSKFLEMKPVVTVTKTVEFPNPKYEEDEAKAREIRSAIKNHIMHYGSLYAQVASEDYDEKTNTLYSTWESGGWIDHAVSIVGWDNNYAKENFPESRRPEKDGAYIALNSWGESFGENGYFYISYEDVFVESGLSGIVSTSITDAHNIETIKNSAINEIITSKLSNTIKEVNGKKYITDLALSRIYELDLSNKGLESINGIELFSNLFSLNLANNNLDNQDLKVLTKLDGLYELNLSNNLGLTDVSSLKDTQLMSLNLSQNENMKGYNEIQTLVALDLSNCNLKDLKLVAKLNDLNSLNLSQNEIKNLEILSKLKQLNTLLLKDINLGDISKVTAITSLEALDLTNTQITDIQGISKLNNLSYLNLSQNTISDFSEIAEIGKNNEYPQSIILEVSDCHITNISIFNNLTNLMAINLENNDITDLSSFYNNSVYELDLSGNKNLSNFQYLNNLENLWALYLEDCGIQDLSDISKIQGLEVLDLANNEVTEVDSLNKLNNLYALSLAGNTDLSGKLKLRDLQVLNIANAGYDKDKFNFRRCSSLEEINMSGCEDQGFIEETILSTSYLWDIILENTNVNEEIVDAVNEKDVWLIGGMLKLKEEATEENSEEKVLPTYEFKKNSPVRKAIMHAITTGGLEVTRGNLNKTITKVTKTEDTSNSAVIKIEYSRNYSDFVIEIEYEKKEVEEKDEQETTKPETENKTETKKKDKKKKEETSENYIMVED